MSQNDGISFRNGFYWPDYDAYPDKCFAFVQKGLTDHKIATGLSKSRDVCIQAGGHAGLWPIELAKSFKKVYSFECEPILFECMRRNTDGIEQIEISPFALGAFCGKVRLKRAKHAGSWSIDPAGEYEIDQITIDSLELPSCGAIFLDIEAYEVEALKGAKETIRKFSPIIHVEELPRSRLGIQQHMAGLGYRLVKKVHGDCIYAAR